MTAPETRFDVEALGAEMLTAARAALADRAPALQSTVEMELRRLAGALADVGVLLGKGEIDHDRARKMIDIYRLAVRSVLRSVEGLSLVAADQAMQAVMRVAGAVLNRVIGVNLIPTPGTSQFKAGRDL